MRARHEVVIFTYEFASRQFHVPSGGLLGTLNPY